MTGNQASHITVTTRTSGGHAFEVSFSTTEATYVYVVSEKILRELSRKRDWLDRRIDHPTGQALKNWLEEKGCRLDSPDGPAIVLRETIRPIGGILKTDTTEIYYRDGEVCRYVRRSSDGSGCEEYVRNGKLHREDGPAYLRIDANGIKVEVYYRNSVRHRDDGPASITRYPDGATIEEYWRDGVVTKRGNDAGQSAPGGPQKREYVPVPRP
jgi:hypothetical protein